MKRFAAKIKEWIIHRLGGITESEIPVKTKIQFKCVGVKPEHFTYQFAFTVSKYNNGSIAEKRAKEKALEELAIALDRAGYVRYTMSDIDDTYNPRFQTIQKVVRADICVVMPWETSFAEVRR